VGGKGYKRRWTSYVSGMGERSANPKRGMEVRGDIAGNYVTEWVVHQKENLSRWGWARAFARSDALYPGNICGGGEKKTDIPVRNTTRGGEL